MRNRLLALLLSALAPAAPAQTLPADFVKVLLPIVLPRAVSGAFGSSWTTDTFLFFDSDTPVRIFPGCNSGTEFCDVEPRATLHFESVQTAATDSRARLLYVAKASATAVAISACLHQGDAANQCVPLPLAREADFRPRIVLPFVPLRPDLRVALRVYSEAEGPVAVRLRMYRLDRLDPFVDETVALATSSSAGDEFPSEPSFVAITDLVARWPQLQAAASVRIQVDRIDPTQQIWAFASVTSNQTQQVQIFSPH